MEQSAQLPIQSLTQSPTQSSTQLYLLYVVDWNKCREWNGGDIIINDVLTHEQLLRWVFNFDMLHLAWKADGICYYDGDDTFNCAVKNEDSRCTKTITKPDVRDRIFNAYIAAFDPSRMFVDKFANKFVDSSPTGCADWSDFCGNQSYCGYLRRLPSCFRCCTEPSVDPSVSNQ